MGFVAGTGNGSVLDRTAMGISGKGPAARTSATLASMSNRSNAGSLSNAVPGLVRSWRYAGHWSPMACGTVGGKGSTKTTPAVSRG